MPFVRGISAHVRRRRPLVAPNPKPLNLVGGATPRCRDQEGDTMITRYICWLAPQHTFTSYVLRRGALESPHRDTRISPLSSIVQAVHPPDFGKDRLWIQDRAGDVPRPLKP